MKEADSLSRYRKLRN